MIWIMQNKDVIASAEYVYPCKYSLFLTILVPLRFIIISLVVFFRLIKLLVPGFFQFEYNFLRGKDNSNWNTVTELHYGGRELPLKIFQFVGIIFVIIIFFNFDLFLLFLLKISKGKM